MAKKMVEDTMKDTRQKTNKVGGNPPIGGQPGKGAQKHEGSKSSKGHLGLKMGCRVTSRDTKIPSGHAKSGGKSY